MNSINESEVINFFLVFFLLFFRGENPESQTETLWQKQRTILAQKK